MGQSQKKIYRNCVPVVDAWYDADDEQPLADVLVETIAGAAGTDPAELPPLYEAIDLDALTQLFERHDGATEADAMLSFTFETWNVFVQGDGRIRVCDATRRTVPEPVFRGEVT
jgi:hypothetical protein